MLLGILHKMNQSKYRLHLWKPLNNILRSCMFVAEIDFSFKFVPNTKFTFAIYDYLSLMSVQFFRQVLNLHVL